MLEHPPHTHTHIHTPKVENRVAAVSHNSYSIGIKTGMHILRC